MGNDDGFNIRCLFVVAIIGVGVTGRTVEKDTVGRGGRLAREFSLSVSF